jgi:hypothetical protein
MGNLEALIILHTKKKALRQAESKLRVYSYSGDVLNRLSAHRLFLPPSINHHPSAMKL